MLFRKNFVGIVDRPVTWETIRLYRTMSKKMNNLLELMIRANPQR